MKKEIVVPSLGESIVEATVGQILVSNGAFVSVDQELLELETDKVNQVLYSSTRGEIQITVKSGDLVKIGQVIGWIEEKEGVSKKEEEKPVPLASTPVDSLSSLRQSKESFLENLEPVKEVPEPSKKERKEEEKETRRPMSKIRKVIAQRLVEAQQTMAMLTTFNEVDMTPIIELREKYKDSFLKKHGCKLGFMSFFVKAAAAALEVFPDVNSYIDGDTIVQRNYFDIGVAVGTEKGVIVPIVRNCLELSFAEIEKEIEIYAKKAREGKIAMQDLQGGGFTITNGGTYGSLLSTPIAMPPQCAILGMHKIEKRPVVLQDQIVIRSMMYLALSYDHRLIDGKEAVSFLVYIKNMLEDPTRLVLGV